MRTISARTAANSVLGAGQDRRGRDVRGRAACGATSPRTAPRRSRRRPWPPAPPRRPSTAPAFSRAAAAPSDAARRRGSSVATAASVGAAASAVSTACRPRSDTPPIRLPATSALSFETGAIRDAADQRGAGASATIAGTPSRRPITGHQPLVERRELARQERMQAAVHEVDPQHRVPEVLAERGTRRTPPHGSSPRIEVAIDALVAGTGRPDRAPPKADFQRSANSSRACLPASLVVGPLVVVAMVAHRGRDVRLDGRTARRGNWTRGRRTLARALLTARRRRLVGSGRGPESSPRLGPGQSLASVACPDPSPS